MAEPSGQKAIIYLGSAVFFGLIAAGLSYLYLKSRAAAIEAEMRGAREELVDVVIAKQNLPKGLKITDAYFDIGQVPNKYVHPNTIRPTNFFDHVGRFLNTDVQAGRTLVDSFLVKEFPVDFSDLVTPERRAITVTVDDVTAFAGLLRPGNRVDLYVNIPAAITGYQPGDRPAQAIPAALQQGVEAGVVGEAGLASGGLGGGFALAQAPKDVILPVLQDVRVLATGKEAYDETLDRLSYPQQRRGDNFTTVTLDVTPEQAALLAIAEDKGDLIAVLRNRHDRGAAQFTGVSPLDLYRNAREMKKAEAIRKAAEAVGATIDANGNWVTSDGRVIDKKDLVIAADGSVTTRGGASLAPSDEVRKAAAAAGATIDANGNWVTKDGRVIPADQVVVGADGTVRTKDGKVLAPSAALRQAAAAAGITIDENGNWVTKDGRVIPADQVVVDADGTVRTKDGKVLAPSAALRQAAAAAGATIDENGNWVTADGQVIAAEDIVVSANGTVATRGGRVLAAKGISVNEKGEYVDANGNVVSQEDLVVRPDGSVTSKQALMQEQGYTVNADGDYVDANGNVIPKEDVVVNADGTVTTKDEIMRAAGYTVNENGDYVDAEGNVVKKDDLKVLANGTVMTADGKVVSGPPVTMTKDGFLVTADGTVMTADGKVLQGVTVNENGEVVTAAGQVLTDPNLTVAADGTVTDASGRVVAGVTGSSLPPGFAQQPGAVPGAAAAVRRLFIALTVGGSSKDGVPLTNMVPVQPVVHEFPSAESQ